MYFLVILLSILTSAGLIVLLINRNTYREEIKENKEHVPILFIAPVSLWIVDKIGLIERFPALIKRVHPHIIRLYGLKNSIILSKLFIGHLLSIMILLLFFFLSISIASDADLNILYIGLLVVAISPVLLIKDLIKKVETRKKQIILELPTFLDKLIIFIHAGETIQQGIMKCILQRKQPEKEVLYLELLQVVNDLKNNGSFAHALEKFNRRCGVQEIARLSTTILMNYRRGGDELVLALKGISQDMWESRKTMAKLIGEEASSKLVFPMVIIFIVIMCIVASPAIMLMNG